MNCFVCRRQPTPPVKEPEPEPEPAEPEQEDAEELRNKVNKLEEEVQHVRRHKDSQYSEGQSDSSYPLTLSQPA